MIGLVLGWLAGRAIVGLDAGAAIQAALQEAATRDRRVLWDERNRRLTEACDRARHDQTVALTRAMLGDFVDIGRRGPGSFALSSIARCPCGALFVLHSEADFRRCRRRFIDLE